MERIIIDVIAGIAMGVALVFSMQMSKKFKDPMASFFCLVGGILCFCVLIGLAKAQTTTWFFGTPEGAIFNAPWSFIAIIATSILVACLWRQPKVA